MWLAGRCAAAGGAALERHCPRCKSSNRHRLIAWRLQGRLRAGMRLLHVAPEQGLGAMLAGVVGPGYVTCDLVRADVDHRLDLQTSIVAQAAFDMIMINHVLEHVPDDRAVLANLARMLAPGGVCLITVPMRAAGLPTDEDLGALTKAARQARFGQDDHLRIYGLDFAEKLRASGYAVTVLRSEDLPAESVERHVMQGEVLFEACVAAQATRRI